MSGNWRRAVSSVKASAHQVMDRISTGSATDMVFPAQTEFAKTRPFGLGHSFFGQLTNRYDAKASTLAKGKMPAHSVSAEVLPPQTRKSEKIKQFFSSTAVMREHQRQMHGELGRQQQKFLDRERQESQEVSKVIRNPDAYKQKTRSQQAAPYQLSPINQPSLRRSGPTQVSSQPSIMQELLMKALPPMPSSSASQMPRSRPATPIPLKADTAVADADGRHENRVKDKVVGSESVHLQSIGGLRRSNATRRRSNSAADSGKALSSIHSKSSETSFQETRELTQSASTASSLTNTENLRRLAVSFLKKDPVHSVSNDFSQFQYANDKPEKTDSQAHFSQDRRLTYESTWLQIRDAQQPSQVNVVDNNPRNSMVGSVGGLSTNSSRASTPVQNAEHLHGSRVAVNPSMSE